MSAAVLLVIGLFALIVGMAAIPGAIAYRIATGCRHKFGIIEQFNVWDGGDRPVARKYTLQCASCGKIKKQEV